MKMKGEAMSLSSIKGDFSEKTHERPWGQMAYKRFWVDTSALSGDVKPGILFLGGFASSMAGSKATFLMEMAKAEGRDCVVFDYKGHGASDGKFEEGTVGEWCDDAISVCDQLTRGPQIVIGSSMGGWLMLLLAKRRPERVKALIGLASSPGFTERLFFDRLLEEERQTLLKKGVVHTVLGGTPYTISKNLIEEARGHLIKEPLCFKFPVHLIHGDEDPVVSWAISHELLLDIRAPLVQFSLIQGGDHSLSRSKDLAFLRSVVQTFSTLT